MKSKVYFIKVADSDGPEVVMQKFARLLDTTKCIDGIQKDNDVVIKIHFGEEGNTGYVNPVYIKELCSRIRKKCGNICLADTNTLYKGRRSNSAEHKKIAYEHGFTSDAAGADIVIPDDSRKENVAHIGQASIVKLFVEADILISVAHFKGHLMTGFGGALKNIGMGCASREGKLYQHSDLSPFVIKRKCTACGACIEACPAGAINIFDNKAVINASKCIGCAGCIAVCPVYAIELNWEAGGEKIQYKMIEYAKAVLDKKKEKAIFINFANKITKECDCLAKDDPKISPDIGIFISEDPVSIDKACYDLVVKACKRDVFKEAHPKRDGSRQLQYAVKLGLGNMEYELVETGGAYENQFK